MIGVSAGHHPMQLWPVYGPCWRGCSFSIRASLRLNVAEGNLPPPSVSPLFPS